MQQAGCLPTWARGELYKDHTRIDLLSLNKCQTRNTLTALCDSELATSLFWVQQLYPTVLHCTVKPFFFTTNAGMSLLHPVVPVSSSESNIESSFEMPDWMASMHWMHYLMGSCGVSRGMLHDASVGQQSGKPDNMDPCSDLKVFLNPCFCDRHSHKDVILRTEYTIRCHSAQTFCNVFDRLSKVRIELSTFITSLL